jgi:hypothetical protein
MDSSDRRVSSACAVLAHTRRAVKMLAIATDFETTLRIGISLHLQTEREARWPE